MTTNSPISCIVVGNGQLSTHNDVVNHDVIAHGPEFKSDCLNAGEAVEGRIVLKVSRVGNLCRSPLALKTEIVAHISSYAR